jgi:hypothetical protein
MKEILLIVIIFIICPPIFVFCLWVAGLLIFAFSVWWIWKFLGNIFRGSRKPKGVAEWLNEKA